MPRWPSAILFDFDGVIVHSEPLHFEAFRIVAAEEKIDLTEEEYSRNTSARSMPRRSCASSLTKAKQCEE
jgi:beta-phosphoglucomutase-like phosphatase (HAD superfamily)